MNAGRYRRNLSADLALILSLLALLAGAAMLLRRGQREGERPSRAVDSTSLPERPIDPTWVHYREADGIGIAPRPLRGVAVAPDDRLLVSAGFTIREYLPDGRAARTFELTTAARCLAVAADGRLYLGAGDHVDVLDPASGEVQSWDSPGERAFFTSISLVGDSVFVGDSGYRRVWRYSLDGSVLRPLGDPAAEQPVAAGDLPSTYFDTAAARDGGVWITDAGRHGVLHYGADGHLLGRWGEYSNAISGFSGCCNPVHLAVLPDGGIVTVEKKPDLVKVHRPDGTFASVVAGPKAFVEKTFVADVAADSRGRIFIADPKQQRVRLFVPKEL